ncbi:Essential recombination function protein [uncultured Caudovirales phage]|uniref:Essential recombination function protein n=1 Tax=uncultured Caudovirales phage TaxID=2100421 RepID=A0A6J5LNY3_9CAUD|nr:Essential recombination function protein [uncultured Caudovirales phage]
MKIYEKLLTIQKRINGLGKDKSTYNYKYVTGDKLLGEIKPMMNDLGLLLKQEVLSIENTRQDYSTAKGNKSEILSKVMMKFTWIDVESGEKDENLFGANGQNDWEKGLGSALTYAERYFLLKYFHIATDEDDIDNDQRKTSAPVPLKAELTELDWINLEAIFESKKEKIDAEKFDAIKKAVFGKNPKFYEYTLATLNKL